MDLVECYVEDSDSEGDEPLDDDDDVDIETETDTADTTDSDADKDQSIPSQRYAWNGFLLSLITTRAIPLSTISI